MTTPPDSQPHPAIVQTVVDGIALGAYNQISQHGDLVAGNKIINLIVYTGPAHPADAASRFSLEQAYRSEVALRYAVWLERYAPLTMRAQVAERQEQPGQAPLEVEEAFLTDFGARFATPVAKPATEEPGQAPTATHTFTDIREGLRRYHDLVLLGPPGAGKTTALWRLALDLVEEGLTQGNNQAPLPIFVRLGRVGARERLIDLVVRELSHAAITNARRQQIILPAHRQLAALLPDLLEQGRVTLLWDGLDEALPERFPAIANDIVQLRNRYPPTLTAQNTSVTTCHAEDFETHAQEAGGVPALPYQQVTIQALDALMTQAVVVGRLGEKRGERLLRALAEPQHVGMQAVVRTPLLLIMLCEAYRSSNHVPASRGQLLAAFVDTRWAWQRQQAPEDSWLRTRFLLRRMERLATALAAEYGRGATAPWEWAKHYLGSEPPAAVLPEEVCRLAQDAELLELDDEGTSVRFTHQLIQEYFAAAALELDFRFLGQPHLVEVLRWREQKSYWKRQIARYLAPGQRTGWEETLFLLAGLRERAPYIRELTHLLVRRPLEALQFIAHEASDPSLRGAILDAATRQIGDPTLTLQQRLDAGAALAALGDPRPGVCTLAPEWCDVPAGPSRMGSDDTDLLSHDDEKPQHTVELPAFQISRYPVTNAQWQRFIEAGGYQERRWWSAAGWAVKEHAHWVQPSHWSDSRFAIPNHPVVGISWYEASAYCRWLSASLGFAVRLPSEAEWEKAARGTDGRIYPWGAAWDAERARTIDSGFGATTAVGCHLHGASPYGAFDMSGNVFEWTATPWRRTYQDAGEAVRETEDGRFFILRGGAWSDYRWNARCACRNHHFPSHRSYDLGVRVATDE